MAAILCGTYVYSSGWQRPCPVYLGISSYFHCRWISQYLQFFVCGGDEGEEDKGEEDDEAGVHSEEDNQGELSDGETGNIY